MLGIEIAAWAQSGFDFGVACSDSRRLKSLKFIVRGGAELVLQNVVRNAIDRVARHGLSETELGFDPWNEFTHLDLSAHVSLKNGIGLRRTHQPLDAVVGVGVANGLLPALHLFGANAGTGLSPAFVHRQAP